LSDPVAATNLAGTVASLRNAGVSVFTYPLAVNLVSPRIEPGGKFEFTVAGPPGVYDIFGSANLQTWSELGVVTNQLGSAIFTDAESSLAPQKFYRAGQP
jgi:hypothetical protein